MPHVARLFAICVLALGCLGAAHAEARAPGAQVSVVICWPNAEPANCGPRAAVSKGRLVDRFPRLAKRAGVVNAPRLKIKCPGTCAATAAGAVTVTLSARPTKDASLGNYEFDHWEGSCRGRTTTCKLRVDGSARIVTVFRSAY